MASRSYLVMLDADSDGVYAHDLTAVVRTWSSEQSFDIGVRVSDVSVAEFVVDYGADRGVQALLAHGRGVRLVDNTDPVAVWAVYTGFIRSVEGVGAVSVRVSLIGYSGFLDYIVDYPLLLSLTTGQVIKRLLGRYYEFLPRLTFFRDGRDLKRYAVVGTGASSLVKDDLVVGPPGPAVNGHDGYEVIDVFDNYVLGFERYLSGNLMSALSKMVMVEGGLLVERGSGEFEIFDVRVYDGDGSDFVDLGGVRKDGIRESVSNPVSVVRGYGYRRELLTDYEAVSLGQLYVAPGEATVDYKVVREGVPVVLNSLSGIDVPDLQGVTVLGSVSGDSVRLTFINPGAGVTLESLVVRTAAYVPSDVFEVRRFTAVPGGRELRLPPVAIEENRVETVVARVGEVVALINQDVREVSFTDDVGEYGLGSRVRVLSGVHLVTGLRHRIERGVLVATMVTTALPGGRYALVGVDGRQELGDDLLVG